MTDIENTNALEAGKEMNTDLSGATPSELAWAVYDILDNKKGKDAKVLHVDSKTVIADYFVLCTGNSSTQVKALADEIEYRTTLRGRAPTHVEGKDNRAWIILDFDSVIVHVFSREAREFYNLDKLYNGTTEERNNNSAEVK